MLEVFSELFCEVQSTLLITTFCSIILVPLRHREILNKGTLRDE